MNGRAGLSSAADRTTLISSTISWSVRSACLFGRYSGTVVKISGPGCSATPGLPIFADARCCRLALAACAC
jgi:hypothetical protein